MSCEWFHQKALDFREGGDIFADLTTMSSHLAICTNCQKHHPSLQEDLQLFRQLKALPLPSLTPDFWENNIGVIRAQIASKKGWDVSRKRSFALGLSSLVGSFLIILLIIFVKDNSFIHSFSEEDFLEATQEDLDLVSTWRDLDEFDLSSLYTQLLPAAFANNTESEVENDVLIPAESLELTETLVPENLSDEQYRSIFNQLESIEI